MSPCAGVSFTAPSSRTFGKESRRRHRQTSYARQGKAHSRKSCSASEPARASLQQSHAPHRHDWHARTLVSPSLLLQTVQQQLRTHRAGSHLLQRRLPQSNSNAHRRRAGSHRHQRDQPGWTSHAMLLPHRLPLRPREIDNRRTRAVSAATAIAQTVRKYPGVAPAASYRPIQRLPKPQLAGIRLSLRLSPA